MSGFRHALAILRQQGPAAVLLRIVQRLAGQRAGRPLDVAINEARDVDWTRPHPAVAHPLVVTDRPLRLAWIMPPPQEASGGHQTLFRFVHAFEVAGHSVAIHYASQLTAIDLAAARRVVESSDSYVRVNAIVRRYEAPGVGHDVDVIVATGWDTAYTSFLDPSPARRFYFVQDFEPLFYPTGSESVLAENTYRFGFSGVTAGGWLADRLHRDYGMTTFGFDFGVDRTVYRREHDERRNGVFFYARPGTTRRGFELGLMALELVARQRPEVDIHLAGWDVSNWKIPFRYVNHKIVGISHLNEIYNECAAGLVLSLTNMSLVPLELLASGTIPVVNDGPNNRLVSDNRFIEYTPPVPTALAERLLQVMDRADQTVHSAEASRSVLADDWGSATAAVVAHVESTMRA